MTYSQKIMDSRISSWGQINFNWIIMFSYLVVVWMLFYEVSTSEVRIYPDSRGYIKLASQHDFISMFSAKRPAGSIFLFNVIEDISLFSFVQALFYSSSILFLFVTIKGIIKNKIVFTVALLYSILFFTHSYFTLWITTALTEMIFFSLMIIALAFFIRIVFCNNFFDIIGATSTIIAISLMRDIGTYYVILYGILFGIVFFVKKEKQILIPVIAALLISIFSISSADQNNRWHFSMLNNFGKRILTSEENTHFFVRHGMPVNDRLIEKAGLWAHRKGPNGFGFYDDPWLVDFMSWFKKDSKKVYMRFLIEHPKYSLGALLDNRGSVFLGAFDLIMAYSAKGYKRVDYGIYNFAFLYGVIAILIISIGKQVAKKDKKKYKLYLVGVMYFLCVIPLAFVGYHADAMEVERHVLPVLFHAVLSGLFFIVLLDRLVFTSKKCDS